MSVTLHTDVGDIKIEVFCERTPKACENFLALCASNYYNGCIFHRNIKGFMVQTGDPTVIDGLETLDELEKLPVNEKTYRPLNDVHIKDITIHANPFAQ
uniref:Peptidyl-prolyl cis-trans isomerase n=1 Tax=Saimiri boliviensis boliviensis TaxID=39432 RepID=A0A2K6TX36_SAIBB